MFKENRDRDRDREMMMVCAEQAGRSSSPCSSQSAAVVEECVRGAGWWFNKSIFSLRFSSLGKEDEDGKFPAELQQQQQQLVTLRGGEERMLANGGGEMRVFRRRRRIVWLFLDYCRK